MTSLRRRLVAPVRAAIARVPQVARLRDQRDDLAAQNEAFGRRVGELEAKLAALGGAPAGTVAMAFPAGHFYSPIPNLDELIDRQDLFRSDRPLPGVDLADDRQLALLERFASYYGEIPYPAAGSVDGLRYRFDNPFFAHGDGIALYSMLRQLRPARMLEVGSGWSSALALDVDQLFLGGTTNLTFIEPYPDRLESLLRADDSSHAEVVAKPLHQVDASLFDDLGDGDILFIDSTHVSRVGSDVNQLILEIVPALAPGVHIHVHDVFFPFEYPKEWIVGGRAWNENYLLHAYLAHNAATEIVWFNSYLNERHHDAVAAALPLWAQNSGGSLWFRTTSGGATHA